MGKGWLGSPNGISIGLSPVKLVVFLVLSQMLPACHASLMIRRFGPVAQSQLPSEAEPQATRYSLHHSLTLPLLSFTRTGYENMETQQLGPFAEFARRFRCQTNQGQNVHVPAIITLALLRRSRFLES